MNEFPWGVLTILFCGLTFTAYIIYYILKMAHEEMVNGEMDSQRGQVPPRQEND